MKIPSNLNELEDFCKSNLKFYTTVGEDSKNKIYIVYCEKKHFSHQKLHMVCGNHTVKIRYVGKIKPATK